MLLGFTAGVLAPGGCRQAQSGQELAELRNGASGTGEELDTFLAFVTGSRYADRA
jgi:hypothetical protein